MAHHRFRIGQMVELDPIPGARSIPGRRYKILERLPDAWGDVRYRIKSVLEAVDRIVKESEFGTAQCIRPDIWARAVRIPR
jgi:hypothetical protein